MTSGTARALTSAVQLEPNHPPMCWMDGPEWVVVPHDGKVGLIDHRSGLLDYHPKIATSLDYPTGFCTFKRWGARRRHIYCGHVCNLFLSFYKKGCSRFSATIRMVISTGRQLEARLAR